MSTPILDPDAIVELRAADWDWLDHDSEVHAQACRELDNEILAGDGIINEAHHGEWCKCWECRI